MAGRGPAGKKDHARARDDKTRDMVKADGQLGGFPLPENALASGEEWHPMTVDWWNAWRESPQAQRMVTNVDWHFLLDTALMHHMMWAKGRWDFGAEVRLRAAKFGATPEDRMRLKLEIEVPEQYGAGPESGGPGSNVTSIQQRKSRYSAGGSAATGTDSKAPF